MGLDGLMTAAAGMEAQQTQLDAVANDLANVSTPGYQAEELGFLSPTMRPVSVDPVNEMTGMSGWFTIAAPTVSPRPCTS